MAALLLRVSLFKFQIYKRFFNVPQKSIIEALKKKKEKKDLDLQIQIKKLAEA